jgi:hypothetical protein
LKRACCRATAAHVTLASMLREDVP